MNINAISTLHTSRPAEVTQRPEPATTADKHAAHANSLTLSTTISLSMAHCAEYRGMGFHFTVALCATAFVRGRIPEAVGARTVPQGFIRSQRRNSSHSSEEMAVASDLKGKDAVP